MSGAIETNARTVSTALESRRVPQRPDGDCSQRSDGITVIEGMMNSRTTLVGSGP